MREPLEPEQQERLNALVSALVEKYKATETSVFQENQEVKF